MPEGTTESNSDVAVAEPAVGQPATTAPETPQGQNGSAKEQGQSASVEEQFSSIDPKTLSPELQGIYKNLQADYTKKTQSVADVRKKAEQFDQLSKDQRFVEYWNGLSKQQKADYKEQKQVAEKQLGEKINDERFQKAFESKDGFLDLIAEVVKETSAKDRQEIEDLKQYKTVNEASSIVESFATEAGPDGKPLRPDFYALDDDGLINGYLRVNAPEKGYSPQEYTDKLNEAYTWSKTLSQKYYEKGKQDALARIQQKASTSTNPPTQAAKGAYTGPDPKKLTPSEAFQMAKKGIKVPQEYD